MEVKSQLWFAYSPFIQVTFGSSKEKKKKKRRNQGMETISMKFLYGKYENYHKPYMGC